MSDEDKQGNNLAYDRFVQSNGNSNSPTEDTPPQSPKTGAIPSQSDNSGAVMNPKDPQADILAFIDDPNTIKKAVEGSMDKRLKVLGDKDPQAELDEILKTFYERAIMSVGQSFAGDPYEFTSRSAKKKLNALFQAHQQQLLTELLGELPEERDYRGNGSDFNDCLSQVVSVIRSKIGELNG